MYCCTTVPLLFDRSHIADQPGTPGLRLTPGSRLREGIGSTGFRVRIEAAFLGVLRVLCGKRSLKRLCHFSPVGFHFWGIACPLRARVAR